jgi:hypothetical protein
MATATIEVLDPTRITDAEKWFMGNAYVYEKGVENPLQYSLTSSIPAFIEATTAYFRANYIPYILYNSDGSVMEKATDYPRSYLRTPAFTQLSQSLNPAAVS